MLIKLILNGMNIVRLNLSHGTRITHLNVLKNLKKAILQIATEATTTLTSSSLSSAASISSSPPPPPSNFISTSLKNKIFPRISVLLDTRGHELRTGKLLSYQRFLNPHSSNRVDS